MRRSSLYVVAALCLSASPAFSAADGPDAWRVTGVAPNDVLMVHREASARSPIIGKLAHDSTGLRNLGCTGFPSFAEWQKMTPRERERRARARWCRVESNGLTGWVAGRFLREDAPRAQNASSLQVGAWNVRCQGKSCVVEQRGIAARKPTVLRIEPVDAPNARIEIERAGAPRSGTLSFYVDGELLTAGPIAQLIRRNGPGFAMEPGDITLGMLKSMRRHRNMVASFPGEERGVEFHLEGLDEAMKELERLKSLQR